MDITKLHRNRVQRKRGATKSTRPVSTPYIIQSRCITILLLLLYCYITIIISLVAISQPLYTAAVFLVAHPEFSPGRDEEQRRYNSCVVCSKL